MWASTELRIVKEKKTYPVFFLFLFCFIFDVPNSKNKIKRKLVWDVTGLLNKINRMHSLRSLAVLT